MEEARCRQSGQLYASALLRAHRLRTSRQIVVFSRSAGEKLNTSNKAHDLVGFLSPVRPDIDVGSDARHRNFENRLKLRSLSEDYPIGRLKSSMKYMVTISRYFVCHRGFVSNYDRCVAVLTIKRLDQDARSRARDGLFPRHLGNVDRTFPCSDYDNNRIYWRNSSLLSHSSSKFRAKPCEMVPSRDVGIYSPLVRCTDFCPTGF